MKILLDECVPWPMHRLLVGHECRTAQQCGWGGIKNGDLLELAEMEFPLFITSDQNLRYQQNLAGRRIAILVLKTTDWRLIRLRVDSVVGAISDLAPGAYLELEFPRP